MAGPITAFPIPTSKGSELTLRASPTLTDELANVLAGGSNFRVLLSAVLTLFQGQGATDTFYVIGNETTDGSWRFTTLGTVPGDLELQVRIATVWTARQSWSGT